MDKRIALLRGINVGGKKKILMADLKLLFQDLGFTGIVTYIQSGNVIFNSATQITNIQIIQIIENAITEKYGFFVPVLVKFTKEIEKAVMKNPFYQEDNSDTSKLYQFNIKILDK